MLQNQKKQPIFGRFEQFKTSTSTRILAQSSLQHQIAHSRHLRLLFHYRIWLSLLSKPEKAADFRPFGQFKTSTSIRILAQSSLQRQITHSRHLRLLFHHRIWLSLLSKPEKPADFWPFGQLKTSTSIRILA